MGVKIRLCGFTFGVAAYVKQFEVVEVQQTFHDPPPPATLERWRAQAPPTFEFTMKAWQVITHFGTSRTYRRLRRPFDDLALVHAVDRFSQPSLTREHILAPARKQEPLRDLQRRGAGAASGVASRRRRALCDVQQHLEGWGRAAISGS